MATITRQYVNGLVPPGVLAAAASGDDVAGGRIQASASTAAAGPLAVLSARAPTPAVGGGDSEGIAPVEEGGVR